MNIQVNDIAYPARVRICLEAIEELSWDLMIQHAETKEFLETNGDLGWHVADAAANSYASMYKAVRRFRAQCQV